MKYYITTELIGQYEVESVYQTLIVAESLEGAFQVFHNKPIDYVYTDADWSLPDRNNYKSDKGYKQACKYCEDKKNEDIAEWNKSHAKLVSEFKTCTIELNIPCNESISRVIEDFKLF